MCTASTTTPSGNKNNYNNLNILRLKTSIPMQPNPFIVFDQVFFAMVLNTYNNQLWSK